MRARIVLILVLLGLWPQAGSAEEAPVACRLGVNVAALYDLEPAKGSFGADLWLWSLCPAQGLSPLALVELPTAKPGLQLGPLQGQAVVGGQYESRRVQGVFRHRWDMRRYPFDRQTLTIRLVETELGAARLTFAADTKDSFVSSGVAAELGEWRIDGFRIAAGTEPGESSFGYPEAQPSRYAWLEAEVILQRSGVLTFLKLALPVFAAALFAILCFYFDPKLPGSFQNQVPILVGVLFAIIINHRRSDDVVGDVGRLTLVTEIHLATILLVIVVAALVFLDRRRAERGVKVRYLDRPAISITVAGYVTVVAGLILIAALRG